MIYKIQYTDNRETIINENTDKILIEEQNIAEGNFLIFTDEPRIEEQLSNISDTVDLILLKQEGVL
ncbi:MAG: hypothetical protein AB7V16_08875 [Vulcanibacillus sp.]